MVNKTIMHPITFDHNPISNQKKKKIVPSSSAVNFVMGAVGDSTRLGGANCSCRKPKNQFGSRKKLGFLIPINKSK